MAETSNTHVSGVELKGNAKGHVGDVGHIQQTEDYNLFDLRNTDPRLDKARIEATKGGLFEDSYRWILEHSDFQQWRDDERSRMLWIKGDPGKGKTMLLCGVVNELSKEDNTLLSYFFCQATDERINSATAVLRGLIYLIVEQQPSLVSHIPEEYKHRGATILKDMNAWSILSQIFSNILEDASLKRIYMVIDALDECVTDLPKLLDFISTKSALFSGIKWLVSSRNWSDIEDHLDSTTQHTKLYLELNADSTSAAVNAYIEHRLEQLAQRKKYDAKTKDAVQHHLSSNSNDTFLWVALVCQNLEKVSLQNTLLKLNEFPPGLDALYERSVKRIRRLEDASDAKSCCRVLATVLLVYRPVTLAELGSLIESSEDDHADAESIYKAIGLCDSFLTMRDSHVYIVHQSVKDYLSDEEVSASLFSSPADVHADIFSRSVQSMTTTLRRNVYNLYSPGLSSNEIKAPDRDPLSTIRYSCIHWVDHFCDMHNIQSKNQVGDEKCQTVFLFLRQYFLYWLEALGLMKHIEASILSMARLEDLLRGNLNKFLQLTQDQRGYYRFSLGWKSLLMSLHRHSPSYQLLEFVQDSRRFIRQNSSVIADSPLQIYASALIFSPLNSLVRKAFKEEEPQWLKIKPLVEQDWRPDLQTFKGHSDWVQSVAFSADGRYLASGSNDKTIKIWDAIIGKERQTLQGHSNRVRSVAFSADGRYLASGSDDKTIKIWDIITGKERQTFKSHSSAVQSVAFSADGRYLASGLSDKSIKIWDIITGKERQTLKGHRDSIWSIAFSADGCHLASGSDDKTIKIWDAMTGKPRRTLKGHRNWVRSVAFSADSRYLASGSDDKTVKIWDITGEERQTLTGHNGWVRSVTFSADGRYLASGSSDKTIKIWDVTSKRQRTFKGHSGFVQSVAFSAGSRYLASGSSDKTIKIWDTASKEQKPHKGHRSSVRSIAFSADGKYLASGSTDKTIKIWDTITGKERQTLEVNATIYAISFNNTASYLHTNICPIRLDVKHRKSRMIARSQSPDLNLAGDQDRCQQITDNSQRPNHLRYGLSTDKRWVTWNEHNILWLPPEYQPLVAAEWPSTSRFSLPQGASTDVFIALGSDSGRVVVIRLPSTGPYPIL